MTIRFASQIEIDNWNNHIVQNPDGGNVFQTFEFAQIKTGGHWTPRFIVAENIFILVLERHIPLLGAFWYVPKGPGVSSHEELGLLLPALNIFAKNNGAFIVKLESEIIKTEDNVKGIKKLGLFVTKGVQVPNTIILDISPTIEKIVSSFSPKTRYNIRAAQKTDISTQIVPINDKNCDIFYDMLNGVIRGRAAIRSREYLRMFWQLHDKAGTGVFMFAMSGNQVVATDFLIILGEKGTRKDAASIRDSSIRGASALLEVEAIKYMKEKGVTIYDFCGSPPSNSIKDETHPYYGFGKFKVGFSTEVTDYIGCFDMVVKPFAYKIWQKIGERIAHRVNRYIHKTMFY